MSYQQCTRFRTTLDFDREYLWNGSSNRQAENGVIRSGLRQVRRLCLVVDMSVQSRHVRILSVGLVGPV